MATPLVNTTIPNLVAGVSQQPDGLRFASQPIEQVNMFSSVVDGLIKRPNTNHIAKLIDGDAGELFFHTINRSEDDKYVVLIRNGSIKVFDAVTGEEKTVTTPDGVAYLSSTSPKEQFRARTVLDYTFITNRSITAAMEAATTTAKVNYAIIFVKQGVSSSTVYTVRINGVDYSYTSSTTDTDAIATGLAAAISSGLGASWTVTSFNYVIKVKKNDNATFTCEAINKSTFGNILVAFNGSATAITDLPTIGFNNDIITITGLASESGDEYYVKFVTDGGGTSGAGKWFETVAPGVTYQLDAATMPHQLIRNIDGTFTFQESTWGERIAGDTDTNINPSFVGKEIQNVSFNKDRLVILSGEKDVYSESGSYFNFFRTTVTSLLDSDPFEASATSDNTSIQYSAAPVSSKFISWGRNGQFLIDGSPLLTPSSVVTTQVGFYTNDQAVDVIPVEDKILYTFKRGEANDSQNNTGVAEFFIDEVTLEKYKNFDITSHIPTYLTGTATSMAVSDNNQIVCLTTSGDKTIIYTYKYYMDNGKRLQTAWFKMKFCDDCDIQGIGFIDQRLMICQQFSDGLYLSYLDVSPALKDAYSNTVFLLDRRVTDEDCTVSYDEDTDTTLFEIPFYVDNPERLLVIGRYTEGDAGGAVTVLTTENDDVLTDNDDSALTYSIPVGGIIPSVVGYTNTSVSVSGDWSDSTVFVGINYDSYTQLSKPLLRKPSANGGTLAVQVGNYFVRSGLLSLGPTKTLTVEIESKGTGNVYKTVYNNRNLGTSNWVIGDSSDTGDNFRFWIQSKNNNVNITLRNDTPYQSSVLAVDYEGLYSTRAKQV